ncbi:MAG: hypothetical protein K1X28_09245 [Parachlamydiales bacterium]|nr:hypothetical protein [Parachlamydiales bacterium]
MNPKHPWGVRLGVGVAMLVLAFIGIVVTNILATGGWAYWRAMVPIYAAMALWLSWYMRRTTDVVRPVTIWHELLHWVGLFFMIFLVEIYLHSGLLSRNQASLVALTLLSLTVFTIGVYIESTFILIGIVLGVFAAIVAVAIQYLYAFTIPALLIGIGIISYMIWFSHQKMTK